MPHNPFDQSLDLALKGKYVRVRDDERIYKGWVERVHHGRGSVVMHDVETDDGERLSAVFVRNPHTVEVIKPGKNIEWRRLEELAPHPEYPGGVTPKDNVVQRSVRNKYAGSFPVVRTDGTIINGHKRVEAARVAGLEHHPVEVIDVTDEQALELLKIAHRSAFEADDEPDDDEPSSETPDEERG